MGARTGSLLVVILALLAVTSWTTAAEIVIRNGSFEDDALDPGDYYDGYDGISEWEALDGAGVERLDPDDGYITPAAVSGNNVAWIQGDGEWLSQELQYDDDTAVTCQEGLSVSLSFWLGRLNDDWGSVPSVIDVFLEAEHDDLWLSFGSTFTFDYEDEGLGQGQWQKVTATLTMTGVDSDYVGQQVWLTFRNKADASWQSEAVLDDVAIVPEPATLSLLAVSGLALLRRRRK